MICHTTTTVLMAVVGKALNRTLQQDPRLRPPGLRTLPRSSAPSSSTTETRFAMPATKSSPAATNTTAASQVPDLPFVPEHCVQL